MRYFGFNICINFIAGLIVGNEGMEGTFLGSQKRIEGADTELTGDVHIHIPDIFDEWVCEKLAQFS